MRTTPASTTNLKGCTGASQLEATWDLSCATASGSCTGTMAVRMPHLHLHW